MNCPSCSTEGFTPTTEAHHGYTLSTCAQCGLMWWTPFKNPGNSFYEERYTLRNFYTLSGSKRFDHDSFLCSTPSLFKERRLLDIGCGTGGFLKKAEGIGFYAEGIDFSEKAIEVAKKHYGLKQVFSSTLNEFASRFPDKIFDVVTAFQMLEHLDDLQGFMDTVKRLLTAKGRLVLSVPNRERMVVSSCKSNTLYGELSDYPPHHLTRWNRASIEAFLKKHNFEVVDMRISRVSLNELRELITQKIPGLSHVQASVVSRFIVIGQTADTKAGKTTMAVYEALKILRMAVLTIFALPVFIYARMRGKAGGMLYAVARRR
ncbi:MAG: class I SAM-dependent methyltransferase [Deltaproteobacteria bacterium]|nr:class I SAM-dependent methyltransferase [Deltaproteobacteria bacterium]